MTREIIRTYDNLDWGDISGMNAKVKSYLISQSNFVIEIYSGLDIQSISYDGFSYYDDMGVGNCQIIFDDFIEADIDLHPYVKREGNTFWGDQIRETLSGNSSKPVQEYDFEATYYGGPASLLSTMKSTKNWQMSAWLEITVKAAGFRIHALDTL